MKGFKPTGFGPKSGFHFPASAGFSGSAGMVNVQTHVRRRAFADGGFVRQDNPRMKSEMTGDGGSAMTRRKKPYAEWQRDVGATNSLLPGFKHGGKAEKKPKMRKANGGYVESIAQGKRGMAPKPSMKPNPQPIGSRQAPRKKLPQIGAIKSKFYEDGGRVVRGSSAKSLGESIKDVPALIKAMILSPKLVSDPQKIMSGRQRQIDRTVDEAVTGKTSASNYAKGGLASMHMPPKGRKGLKKAC